MSAALSNNAARCLAEASAWRVHLTEIDAESTEAFEDWLAANPGNADAWRRVERTWNRFAENPAAPELIAARRAALGDRRGFGMQHWQKPRRQWLQIAAAIALAVGGGYWALQSSIQPKPPLELTTAFGERRIVTLNDGSRISLDSGSDVQVRYSEHARELMLLRGQARFQVAHDATKPFSVLARGQKVIATGTDFDVDAPQRGIFVTLIEGHVKILGGKHIVQLQAGEQLAALPDSTEKIANVNINRVMAWESGQLIFDNEPLSSVVERVSRYATIPIVVADAKTGALHMSGVFNTGDVAAFIEAVTHYLPVRASQSQYGAIQLHLKN